MRLLALLLALAALASWVSAASGYTLPSGLSDGHDYSDVCPPRPADYSGEDATVAALVVLGQEAADSCVRGEQLAKAADERLAAVESSSAAVQARLDGWQSSGLPAFAAEPSVSVSDFPSSPSGGASAADVEGVRLAVYHMGWFLVGAVSALIFWLIGWRYLIPIGRSGGDVAA